MPWRSSLPSKKARCCSSHKILIAGHHDRLGKGAKLGNGKWDVIDIGTLRAIMMKTGQWVNADRYNRRIVTIANSLVFKELVFNYSGEFANEAKGSWGELIHLY